MKGKMKATNPRLRPMPCGAPRVESARYSGYADHKSLIAHVRACNHEGCVAIRDKWNAIVKMAANGGIRKET